MFKIYTEYPLWFILLCIITGIVYALLLYRRNGELGGLPSWLIKVLFGLRALAVFSISFLLLGPFFKITSHTIEKPIVIIAHDNSESLKGSIDTQNSPYLKSLYDLRDKLSEDFDVQTFTFGSKVNNDLELNFEESSSNFSQLFEELENRFVNRNIGAIIMASDGIYNSGINPIYLSDQLNAPVFAIALGDTNVKKDLILNGVRHNNKVVVGNTFSTEVILNARQCNGSNSMVRLYKDSTLIASRDIRIAGNRFSTTIPFFIEAKEKGIHEYTVIAEKLDNETTYGNNTQKFYIEVIESKNKVLILGSAPHPDLGAIKTSLENNFNYEADIYLGQNFKSELSNYNCVILHQIPSLTFSGDKIITSIHALKIPSIYILGGQSNINQFNGLNKGLEIRDHNGKINEAFLVINKQFSLFAFEEESQSIIADLPPLITPFGTYVNTTNNYVFGNQRIGGVKTDQPLVLFNTSESGRTAIIAGEGFWRWKLHEYSEFQSHKNVDEFLLRCVQYVSTNEKNSPFKVTCKASFNENENVLLNAELYNESDEMVNSSDVVINIIQQNTKANFLYTFSKTDKAYTLNAGNLAAGVYSYKATTKLGDKTYTQEGRFTVNTVQIEFSETVANHQLLYTMAEKTNGQLIYPDSVSNLSEIISNRSDIKPVSYEQNKSLEIINLKWFFFLICLLIFLEWAIRKYNGAY